MKYFAILFIIFSLVSVSGFSQQQLASAKDAQTVEWNEMTHDFGKLTRGKPATATFTFENKGDVPVVISKARSSCGCTVAEYTKEPVKPGDEGIVKATYNSARVGNFSKTVTVTFGGANGTQILRIKGTVVEEKKE